MSAAITAASVFGLGLGTYSFVRRDELLRETRTSGATHFLTWGVMAIGIGALALSSAADLSLGTSALIYAIATIVAYAAGIAWAEVQIANGDDAAIATPLLGWSGPL
jgi:FtsH-binding integral membrane protein